MGRIGPGSDVQGWDDERSRDHDWGVRLTFLTDDPGAVEAVLARQPARFRTSPDGVDVPGDDHHGHDVTSLDEWLSRRLGDIRPPLGALDWLAIPEQSLLELTGGEVFRDDTGALTRVRRQLAYLPDDVWLAKLAAGWWHLSIEASYVGRAAEVGDELGWRVLAARQVDRLVHLSYLLARRYRPYRKWAGSALPLDPPLLDVVRAPTVEAALDALGAAEQLLWERQRALLPGLPPAGPPPYRPELWRHDLPAMAAATAALVPEGLRSRLRWPIGGVDQWADWPGNSGDALLAARTYIGSPNG